MYPEGVGNVREVGDGDELFDHAMATRESSRTTKLQGLLMRAIVKKITRIWFLHLTLLDWEF